VRTKLPTTKSFVHIGSELQGTHLTNSICWTLSECGTLSIPELLYFSAEWVPAFFIVVFSIALEGSPFMLTRRLLQAVCASNPEICVDLIKQKTLLEFGVLSILLATIREAVLGHTYTAIFAAVFLICFLCCGYLWLTLHLIRRFTWVRSVYSCLAYMAMLIATTLTIRAFGQAFEEPQQVSISLLSMPLAFLIIVAALVSISIFFLQKRKAEYSDRE